MEEVKMSEQLASKLENEGIKSSVEGLIDFKKIVDEYYQKDNLTDREREVVSVKLEKITAYYERLNNILKSKTSNELKNEKIKELLSEIGIEELDDIQGQIDKIFDKDIDELIQIVGKRHEQFKNVQMTQKLQQEIGMLKEYCDSTKQTVSGNALIKKPKGFFERLIDTLNESTNDWIREDIEKDGKHIVIYKNEDGFERKRYESSQNIAENKKRDDKARKFGFFSRIKAAMKEENTNEVDKKKNAIDKQFNEISTMVIEGAKSYANEKEAQFNKSIASKERVPLKNLMNKLEPKYEWAKKKNIELEMRKYDIEQEIEQIDIDSQIRIEKMNQLVDEMNQQVEILEEAGKIVKELNGKKLRKEIEYRFMKGEFNEPNVLETLKEYRTLQVEFKAAQERYRELENDYKQNIGEKNDTLKRVQEKFVEYEKKDAQKRKELEEELKKITMEQEKLEQRNLGPEK